MAGSLSLIFLFRFLSFAPSVAFRLTPNRSPTLGRLSLASDRLWPLRGNSFWDGRPLRLPRWDRALRRAVRGACGQVLCGGMVNCEEAEIHP
jgi:hypothetical protein